MIPYTLGDKSFFKGQYFSVLVLIKNLSFYDSLEMENWRKKFQTQFFFDFFFFLICQFFFSQKKIVKFLSSIFHFLTIIKA